MHTRIPGNKLEVSAIGLDCVSIRGGYSGSRDRQEMIPLIRSASRLSPTGSSCRVRWRLRQTGTSSSPWSRRSPSTSASKR